MTLCSTVAGIIYARDLLDIIPGHKQRKFNHSSIAPLQVEYDDVKVRRDKLRRRIDLLQYNYERDRTILEAKLVKTEQKLGGLETKLDQAKASEAEAEAERIALEQEQAAAAKHRAELEAKILAEEHAEEERQKQEALAEEKRQAEMEAKVFALEVIEKHQAETANHSKNPYEKHNNNDDHSNQHPGTIVSETIKRVYSSSTTENAMHSDHNKHDEIVQTSH